MCNSVERCRKIEKGDYLDVCGLKRDVKLCALVWRDVGGPERGY